MYNAILLLFNYIVIVIYLPVLRLSEELMNKYFHIMQQLVAKCPTHNYAFVINQIEVNK